MVDGAGKLVIYNNVPFPFTPDFPETPDFNEEDFPLRNAVQAQAGGGWDGFLFKVDPSGPTLEFSTYLGGESQEFIRDIAVDSQNDILVTGETDSPDFPREKSRFTPGSGEKFLYSTMISEMTAGGSGGAWGLAVDDRDEVHIVGETRSSGLPVSDPF